MLFNDFTIQETADGTPTLYSANMQESYHSMNGASQESYHVFIHAGLECITKQVVRIFEVGFGTGLNALLSWENAVERGIRIQYYSTEAYPIPLELMESIRFDSRCKSLPEKALQLLHQCDWEKNCDLDSSFSLHKTTTDFTRIQLPDQLDLVYFDAFSPDKQPEMWEESLFRKLYEKMLSEGILVTYCAKGEVRRRMQRAGFVVERIPGPPGKREMLRARKP